MRLLYHRALCPADGAFLEGDVNSFCMWRERYNGTRVDIFDYISEAQTQGSSNVATTICALQFGEGRLCGLQGGGVAAVEAGSQRHGAGVGGGGV
jgi:hypothetical protein